MKRYYAIIGPALFASALAVCVPAQATTFAGSGSTNIVNGSGAFFDTMIPAGSFTDTIDFSVPSSGTADVGVLYFQFLAGITGLTASFNGAPITFSPVAGSLYAGGISSAVGGGPQQIQISGFSGGLGSYSGNVTFSSAVPEIGTWLMMVAGVGLAGFALRRRKPAYKVGFAF